MMSVIYALADSAARRVAFASRMIEMLETTRQTRATSQITPLPTMAPTSAGLLSQMTTPH
jgi:hypothetical protein